MQVMESAMQLNARDAATLMGVSEKTIYRWIRHSKLPAFRINGQYRFNRAEVLEWATAQRVNVPEQVLCDPGEQAAAVPMLVEALKAGGIHYRVGGAEKASVLQAAVDLMPLSEDVDRSLLLRFIVARENLASTGIGNGVAIPHPRSPIVLHVPRPMIALCFLEHAVEFGALDGVPVRAVFAIVSPTVAAHLGILSRLAFALRQEGFADTIARQGTREEIVEAAARIDDMISRRAAGDTAEEGVDV
jgi:nitrogen PTS system EIIA component